MSPVNDPYVLLYSAFQPGDPHNCSPPRLEELLKLLDELFIQPLNGSASGLAPSVGQAIQRIFRSHLAIAVALAGHPGLCYVVAHFGNSQGQLRVTAVHQPYHNAPPDLWRVECEFTGAQFPCWLQALARATLDGQVACRSRSKVARWAALHGLTIVPLPSRSADDAPAGRTHQLAATGS